MCVCVCVCVCFYYYYLLIYNCFMNIMKFLLFCRLEFLFGNPVFKYNLNITEQCQEVMSLWYRSPFHFLLKAPWYLVYS